MATEPPYDALLPQAARDPGRSPLAPRSTGSRPGLTPMRVAAADR
jgi:hypothetical protein